METKIQTIEILKDFHKITGARISLHDLEFKEIAAYPKKASYFCEKIQLNKIAKSVCHESDEKAFQYVKKYGKAHTYKCHCGLLETVAPIYNYGTLTGYFMMGQISDDSRKSMLEIKELSHGYFENNKEFELALKSIPKTNPEFLKSYINVLEVLAEYMTQTNRIPFKTRDIAESVKNYIKKNYSKKLSIENLSETFGCSRTTLMNAFAKNHGQTIGNYITLYRLSKAESMLKNTNESIKNIALSCGFSDQNYFVKVFRNKNNCTPTNYRNSK
jgi:AraC-like DNA-binding protein